MGGRHSISIEIIGTSETNCTPPAPPPAPPAPPEFLHYPGQPSESEMAFCQNDQANLLRRLIRGP